MCEKCDLKNYEDSWQESTQELCYDELNEKEFVYIEIAYNKKLKKWFLQSLNCCQVEIHYCPFCGRKLEEEE